MRLMRRKQSTLEAVVPDSVVFPEGTRRLSVWTARSGDRLSVWQIAVDPGECDRSELRTGTGYDGDLLGEAQVSQAVLCDVVWSEEMRRRPPGWIMTQLGQWRSVVAQWYAAQLKLPFEGRS